MTPPGVLKLALQSVLAPRDVARLLLSIHPSREVLLTGFALVVVLNTLVFSLSHLLVPGPVPALLASPASFGLLQALALAVSILGLTWAGRLFGGMARIEDVAIVLIWLQALRALLQALMLLLLPLSGVALGMVLGAATVVGLWILLHFINEAHDLRSLAKSAVLIVLTVIAMAFALSFLLALAGVDANGIASHV